jgi:hypothetical protein
VLGIDNLVFISIAVSKLPLVQREKARRFGIAVACITRIGLLLTLAWLAGLTQDLAVGHYKPINSDRFVNDCHEFVFHFTPGGRTRLDRRAIGVNIRTNQCNPLADRRQQPALPRQHLVHPYETIQSRDKDRPHPATFPPRLADYCLRLHGLQRLRLAMDPFLGLGSTAVACAGRGGFRRRGDR